MNTLMSIHMVRWLHPLPQVVVLATCSLLFGAAAEAQVPRISPQDTMAQRMQACTVCHGRQGRSTNQGYVPRIAGKPAAYLTNQLINFRDGRRNNAAMANLVEHMSDDYLREIGRYFAELELPYPPPKSAETSGAALERGRQLVKQGDGVSAIPACTQCHGDKMTGTLPATPGLLGLPRDYLIAQFGAWRTGQRQAHSPDCMRDMANRLSPEDISAVATWLSAQALPTDTRPAQRAAKPSPIQCGSAQP